ncbi:MAG: bifunctional nuclease family protein [Oligoflexia bacterium]|nr:bifunctional nuclease family protein [Oligoflexia bacterium]
MSTQNAVEMFVGGLVLDPNTQAPVIVLKDESGNLSLPIWIGIAEATSIASAIKQVTMARPLTHDLMNDVFIELGIKVERVVITELKESTYFAELVLAFGDKAIILDARPSDAIALALRATAPIYVTQQVLDQAKLSLPPNFQVPAGTGKPEEGGEEEEAEQGGAKTDLKHVDKDKWTEILDNLDPEDFKYKM